MRSTFVAGMTRTGRAAVTTASLLGVSLLLSACNAEKDLDLSTYVEQTDPADVLYNQALANMNAGRLKEASAKFESIDRQHPYSEYARKAMVMNTFANYRQGNYDEAINGGKRYVALYPTTDDAAYAQYLVGMSYFRQIPDITRDQEMAARALAAMDKVVREYPESEYADDARRKTQVARDQLAGQEMMIGRYYLERKNFAGSLNRFKTVVKDYQTTRHVEEALLRLVETYLAMGVVSEAQTAAAVLGHNYPDSEWYKDAYAMLDTGGYQPQRNKRSWISAAFDAAIPG